MKKLLLLLLCLLNIADMSAPEGWSFFRRSSDPSAPPKRSPEKVDFYKDFQARVIALRSEGLRATTPRNDPNSTVKTNEETTTYENFSDSFKSLSDDVLRKDQLTAMQELDVENNPLSRKRVRGTDTIKSLDKKITAVEGLIKLLTAEKIQKTKKIDDVIQTYYKGERIEENLKTYQDALKEYNENNLLEVKRISALKKQLKALQDGKVAMEKDNELMKSGDNYSGETYG
jgi:hypothetical protein